MEEKTFLITGPTWIVVLRSDLTPDAAGLANMKNVGFPVCKTDAGIPFLPIFTDNDLADRYIKAVNGEKTLLPMCFATPDDFFGFLRGSDPKITHVGFDCIPPKDPVFLIPREDALRDRPI